MEESISISTDSGNEATSDSVCCEMAYSSGVLSANLTHLYQDSEEHELLKNNFKDRGDSQRHAIETAPVVMRDVLTSDMRPMFSQRGLLGNTLAFGYSLTAGL